MQTSSQHKLIIEQYSKQGELQQTYSPLQNMLREEEIVEFSTSEISYNLKNFVDVETQLSYDDSINLILNNDEEPPRIINTQFRKLGNNRYEYLTRNQSVSTNLYDESNLVSTTDLFLRSDVWPIIDLIKVGESGQLMGGNYVFYIKYCDEDFNESDIVAESSIVSVFKGSLPNTINGALLDERTNKHIDLKISNIDNSFKKFYLYFSRDTSDLNGISLTKYYKITDPMTVSSENTVCITGYEVIEEVSRDSLFINYNYFTAAKTHAVTQNMLFLGNVKTSEKDYPALQQASYKIGVTLKQKETSIGYISNEYASNYDMSNEYYNPKNIYYYLGYWPDEYYSLGICYILNDGTVTNSFALYGGKLKLNELHSSNDGTSDWSEKKYEVNKLLDGFNNTGGIFKLPKVEIINHEKRTVRPLYFEFSFSDTVLDQLKNLNVIGYFFTRTKRIPTSLFQGFSVGIDDNSGIPMPYVSSGVKIGYIAESFVDENTSDDGDKDSDRKLSENVDKHLRKFSKYETDYHALISLDPMVNPQLHSMLSWNKYVLEEDYNCTLEGSPGRRLYEISSYEKADRQLNASLVYIEKEIPSFYIEEKYFATKAGAAESVREIEFLESRNTDEICDKLLRGNYCPIIGTNKKLNPSTIYTVKNNIENEEAWFLTLLNSKNPYFAITNRFKLENTIANKAISAYRGDCFTSTVTIRLNRNFIDPTFPSNDLIVDEYTWQKNYKGLNKMSDKESDKINDDNLSSWTNINLGDLNAVPLGLWITFKCLSNYNLGLRSEDSSDVGLIGKLGNKGTFYPLSGINDKSGGKIAESQLLNDGYSVTLSRKSYNKWIQTPYENWNFENRIAFSNIASTKMFTNGFRVFQGLAYQDVDKQFGQIVKLFPYAQNLLCVFEHGLAIVPINEKALLSTQEGLSIHLYGAGVLQEQVSVISPDYGSTWMESLIKTPDAYYGVDTSAKKIWKFNNTEGFQCISDFKIQSFLNDNLNIDWDDKFFMGATNVRTHYNNFKGDVIFTFYNENDAYSLCYNERMKMWVSRYSWMPLLSANIDNQFYSFNRSVIEKYTKLYKQTAKESGIICEDPLWRSSKKFIEFKYKGLLEKDIILKIDSIKIDNTLTYASNNIKPIITDNEINGIYYEDGIDGLFSYGGAINDNNSNYTYIPIRNKNVSILLYTKDLLAEIPEYTFVYLKNNQLYITPSTDIWQVYAPEYETGWKYIKADIKFNTKPDSEGNIWYTYKIDKSQWSKPEDYTGIEKQDVDFGWERYIDFNNTEKITNDKILLNSYVALSNKVGDIICTSSIPLVEWAVADEDNIIDYTEHRVYPIYMLKNKDVFEFHIPEHLFDGDDVQLTIKAYHPNSDNIIETYTITIDKEDRYNESLALYKHDINSNICHWYDKQYPFEYEFVVNLPTGFHKIFNNLVIISNNVEPESLEVEIVGDSYDFKEEFIKQTGENIKYKFPIISLPKNKIYQTKLTLDKVTNEHRLVMHQDCLNIKDFGRRLGNISYIEGKWYVVLQPIYYEDKTLKTTRLRDKWAKIRIKYSGEKLAIITAIQTLMNISY